MRLKLTLFFIFISICLWSQTTNTFSTSGTFPVAAGLTSITAECWGAGGAGGGNDTGASAGGGGGGGYSKALITVSPNTSINYSVGVGGAGTLLNGTAGTASIFSSVTASGGGGGTSGSGLAAGVGGASGTGATHTGGKGGNGSLVGLLYAGGGGSSAGTAANGNNGAALGAGGGAAVTGGGAGGNGGALDGAGASGSLPGGGGGGGLVLLGAKKLGGNGGNGQIKITYTCPIYKITATNASDACVTTGTSLIQVTSTTTPLPVGNYTVAYNINNPAISSSVAMTVDATGSGSFTVSGLTIVGTSVITITGLTSGTCTSPVTAGNKANIVVSAESAGGSVTGGTTICSGFTSSGLALSGQTGAVVKWQSSVSPFSAWTDIPSTANSTTYTSGALTQTTQFRAVVKNGACDAVNSISTTVTVNPNPTIATSGTVSGVCQSSGVQTTSLIYTATTNSPTSYSIQWTGLTNQASTNFNFTAGGSSVNNINVPANTPVGTYNGIMTIRNLNGCIANQNISLTVNANPTITTSGAIGGVCESASSQTTSLTYSATTGSPLSYSIQWTGIANQGATALSFSSSSGSINNIIVPANTPAGSYTGVMTIFTSANCTATHSVSLTVNAKPTITTSGVFNSVCQSTTTQTTTLNYSSTTGTPVNYAIDWVTLTDQGSTPFPFSSGSGTIINVNVPANTAAGTYNGVMTISTVNGCPVNQAVSLTVNSVVAAPTASATQQPSCQDNSGVITVTSPPIGTGFFYSKDGVDYTNTSGIFTGLAAGTYNIKVKNGASGCESPATPIIINPLIAKVWNGLANSDWANGANWTPSGVPLASDCVDIPSTANPPVISGTDGTFFANKLTVENNGSLIVQGTNTITVTNEVKVLGNGIFMFENNSSLVQVSNAVNAGNIIYKRDAKPARRYDITHWSSPVTRNPAFKMHDLSPETLRDKYAKYNPVDDTWIIVLDGNEEMIKGVGYSIRAPQPYSIDTPEIYPAQFIGVPNNGDILGPDAIPEKFNLLGNPYPSALYADQFIHDNTANIYGTLYIWTHNTLPKQRDPADGYYYYSDDDFAIYNLSGSVTVGGMVGTPSPNPGNQNRPDGYIAAGQGFFVKSKTNQKALFTNSMRKPGRNSQFFKSNEFVEIERHRVWLNLYNTEGAFKQLLLGYATGATNSWDNNFDALSLDANPFLDFYSINENKKLVIQGRALPFTVSDTIQLGYRAALEGEFIIAIDHADGNLSNQAVYLQDNTTKKVHNLAKGGYTFTTVKGVFNKRFVLRYTDPNDTLGNEEFSTLDNVISVSVKDKNIKIQSFSENENLQETSIYDVGGKLLYQKKGIDNKEWIIADLRSGPQIMLVKITLDNGQTVTKKIIFN